MLALEVPATSPTNPLSVAPQDVGRGSPIGFEVVPENDNLIGRFAEALMGEYAAAKQAGREKVVFYQKTAQFVFLLPARDGLEPIC